MTSKETLFCCWLVLAAVLLCAAANPIHPSGTPDLYRFAVIRIAKGTVIQTQEGLYIALGDERWFSEQQWTAVKKENAHLQELLQQTSRLRQAEMRR